jgi:Cu-Zn family superoxide dismutase
MNRTLLFAAAATGLLSIGLVGAGCEHESSSSSSSSPPPSSRTSTPMSQSSRAHTGANESPAASVQATGQPGAGVSGGTGTTASGQTTGNVTTGGQTASVNASSSSATPGETAATSGQGPAGVDQQNATGAAAAAAAAPPAPTARADDAAAAAAAPPAPTARADDAAGAAASASNTNAADPAPPAAAASAGPSSVNQNESPAQVSDAAQTAAAADKGADHHAMAVAHVKPASGAKDEKVTGTVKFMAGEHGVTAMIDLKGLKPDSKHGFHIHEKGDLSSPDLKSAGAHFDPGMTKHHGGPKGDMRHGGDFGNITADDKGEVKTEIMVHGITIDGEKDGIVGRSVIVHGKADDLKSQPAGDAGDRIAGGVIEKAKGEHANHAEKKADAGPAGAGDAARTASDKEPAAGATDQNK